jgi:hypothetical protein
MTVHVLRLLLLPGVAALLAPANAQAPVASVQRIDPPLFGFYGKLLMCGGIPVRASAVVDDRALVLACGKIDRMLAHLPGASQNLVQRGAELHIIGSNQTTSALPELHELAKVFIDNITGKKTNLDKRSRGEGGIYSSCGEENLLGLRGDRYRGGSDICTHEFAHDVMNFGLDPSATAKIVDQYKRSTGQGLWKKAYAALNPREYFAELSMWYFGAHGDFVSGHSPAPGPAGLRSYDPGSYELLDAIYTGREDSTPIHMVPAAQAGDDARSEGGTPPSRLIIANNTDQTLKLLWLDFSGNLRSYGVVFPYDRRFIGTYISHVWIFQDASGKTVARYQANAPDCEIVLNPPAPN